MGSGPAPQKNQGRKKSIGFHWGHNCNPTYIGVIYMDVSKNRGTPKSSISIGFSILGVPLFLETSIYNSI